MFKSKKAKAILGAVTLLGVSATPAFADTCDQLARQGLTYAALKSALNTVVNVHANSSGGLGFPMWLTMVDGSGRVCAVVNSLDGTAQNADVTADIWLGSRVISAQKANTANAFSTGKLALSTANLYTAVQPGGSLFGLQESNPVDVTIAYRGSAGDFGTNHDPLMGQRIGGINVFGGGLALYKDGKKMGAIGVSGDTSCTDHVVAYKVRTSFQASGVVGSVPAFGQFDKMFQVVSGGPGNGFEHPSCLNNPTTNTDGGSISYL